MDSVPNDLNGSFASDANARIERDAPLGSTDGDVNGHCNNPCQHHPFWSKYPTEIGAKHLPTLQQFVADLSEALGSFFPRRDCAYEKVYVLFISWVEDDLGTINEIRRLESIFDTTYGYTTEKYEIKSEARAQNRLQFKLSSIVEEIDSPSNLLIVYYGGHGFLRKEDSHSMWQPWIRPPPNSSRYSPTTLDWTVVQVTLQTTFADVLTILDCCYATNTALTTPSGTKELLAASGFHDEAGGVDKNSFTSALIDILTEKKGAPHNVTMLHAFLVERMQRRKGRATPCYLNLAPGNIDSQSIRLAPLASKQNASTIKEETINSMCEAETRVLISITLDNPDEDPITEEWQNWFTKQPPRNIGGVEVDVRKFVNLEAGFKHGSSYLIVSLPIAIWNAMPSNSAYRFLTFVKSKNVIKQTPDTSISQEVHDLQSLEEEDDDFETASEDLDHSDTPSRPDRTERKYRPWKYDPLPKGRGAIRILKLFHSKRDTSHIDCELLATTISDGIWHKHGSSQLHYEALSWYWGDSQESECVRIRRGRRVYVKHINLNLYSALRALRHTQKDRYLWIDAICVDQDNVQERSRQVEMAHDIFWNADQVCVWLGDSTPSSRMAMTFIDKEVIRLKDFDQLLETKDADQKWCSLLQLMQHPWFSRRWVVQEIGLTRNATIYCGNETLSWSKFAIAVELFIEIQAATNRLSELMKKDQKRYDVPTWLDNVSHLGAGLLVSRIGSLLRRDDILNEDPMPQDEFKDDSDYGSGSDVESNDDTKYNALGDSMFITPRRAQPVWSLEYLVSSLYMFNTTVPHDTIYALLAAAKDTTAIAAYSDYTRNFIQDIFESAVESKRYNVDYSLPYADVCREFIQFCVQRSLRTDPTRALDIICRSWATDKDVLLSRWQALEAGHQTEDGERTFLGKPRFRSTFLSTILDLSRSTTSLSRRSEDLRQRPVSTSEPFELCMPSWIPQLSGAPLAMYKQAGSSVIKLGRKNADSLVGLPSPCPKNYSAAGSKGIYLKSFRFRKRAELGHYSLYVRGFVLDTITNISDTARSGAIPIDWTDLADWPGTHGDPPERFWRTLVANRGKDSKSPPAYYSRACKEVFALGGFIIGSVNTNDFMNNERNSLLSQFCERVQAVTWNRRMVKTASGRLGLVGKGVQVGDHVCILYGCSVPVILRKSKPKEPDVLDREMELELAFLANMLKQRYREYRQRIVGHRSRRARAQLEYYEWKQQKREEWLQDESWRKNWRQKQDGESGSEDGSENRVAFSMGPSDLPASILARALARSNAKQRTADPRLMREFNAWLEEQREASLETGLHWRPPGFNWREFQLMCTYGRIWRRRVQETKDMIYMEARAKIRERFGRAREVSKDRRRSSFSSDITNAARHGPFEELFTNEKHQPQWTLTWEEKREYDKNIRQNFIQRHGTDGWFYWEMLGECYIDGMMDGEAMAYQNRHNIPPTVFELR